MIKKKLEGNKNIAYLVPAEKTIQNSLSIWEIGWESWEFIFNPFHQT